MSSYEIVLHLEFYVDEAEDDTEALYNAIDQLKEMHCGEIASHMTIVEKKESWNTQK